MPAKKVVVALLVTIFVLGIVACSSGGSNNGGTINQGSETKRSEEGEKITLRFAFWGGGARVTKYNNIIADFEKKHPQIKIEAEVGDFGPYWDKLATQTAAGNPPDLFQQHFDFVNEYAAREQLYPLDDFIEQEVIDLSGFNDSVIDSGRVNGQVVMITMGNSLTGLLYNETVFNDAGVEPPNWDLTWEEFEEKAIELANAVDRDDFYAVEDHGRDSRVFEEYLRSKYDTQFFTSDGKLGFNEEQLTEYLEMWQRLRDVGAAPPADITEQYSVDVKEMHGFPQGVYGMTMKASNHLAAYQNYTDDVLSITRIPYADGGEMDYLTFSGAYLSISPYSKHKEEAAEFINYWVNDEFAATEFLLEQGVPGNSNNLEAIKAELSDTEGKVVDYVSRASINQKPFIPDPAGGSGVRVVLFEEQTSNSVAFGTRSIEEAVNYFFSQANQKLD